MERKNFILAGLGASAMLALGRSVQSKSYTNKAFKVSAGKSRFNEKFLFQGKHPNDIKISKKDTDNNLAVFEYTGYERTSPPLHIHLHQDEIFYVLEGKYRFVVGSETILAEPGDTIFLPRNVAHTWLQLTDKGKLIYMVQPAGSIEKFFRTMNNLTHIPTPEEVDKIHVAHGMKVVGPPLSL